MCSYMISTKVFNTGLIRETDIKTLFPSPKRFYQKNFRADKFSKVAGHKINIKKSVISSQKKEIQKIISFTMTSTK